MGLLTEGQYLATMGAARDLAPAEAVHVDLGGYLDSVPQSDHEGFDFSTRQFSRALSMQDGAWQHVVLAAHKAPNVFLVIVIDGTTRRIHGHHLLDLNALYGLGD